MFKKGDVVTCLDAEQSDSCLTLYKEYTVLDIENSHNHPTITIIDDEGVREEYYAFRFVLVPTRKDLIKIMFAEILNK